MQTSFAVYDALAAIAVPPDKLRVVVQSLEHDLSLFARQAQFIDADRKSDAQYAALRAEMAAFRDELQRLDRRFGQVDSRFGQVDSRFEQIDKRFEQVDKRFEQVDKRFEQVDKRFEQVDRRFEQVDMRFEELKGQMIAMEARIENRLVIKLGALHVVSVGTLLALIKLFKLL